MWDVHKPPLGPPADRPVMVRLVATDLVLSHVLPTGCRNQAMSWHVRIDAAAFATPVPAPGIVGRRAVTWIIRPGRRPSCFRGAQCPPARLPVFNAQHSVISMCVASRPALRTNSHTKTDGALPDFCDVLFDQTPIELRTMHRSGDKASDASVTYRTRAAALRTG